MCTIKISDLLVGRNYPDAGRVLYDLMVENKDKYEKIILDMDGVSSLPSMFLNTSIGKMIEDFGIDSVRMLSFRKITRLQAERIKEYVNRYKIKELS